MLGNFCGSKFIFFGIFTLLCSGFPFSSLFSIPGVCSRGFEGLIKYPRYENITIILSILLIGFYLLISGIGLINLSGCLIRLGMPSDYPNSVVRALLYSHYRTDSSYINKYNSKDSNVYFASESNSDIKNNKYKGFNRRNYENHNSIPPLLTTQGELKKRFKKTMRTFKARFILCISSMVVIVCLSYASFVIFESSQIFLGLESIKINQGDLNLLNVNSEFFNPIMLLIFAAVLIVMINMYMEGVFILSIISWINFFGLIFFSILSVYLLNEENEKGIQTYETQNISVDWDVRIWGILGGTLEIGAFVISSLTFHLVLPGAFKILSTNEEIRSSKVWGITILLTLFIFMCKSLMIIGLIPSFPILPYGFEPNGEGTNITWLILESKLSKYDILVYKLMKHIFLIGNFLTWVLFASIAMKCMDNIIRCVFDDIDCEFEAHATKYSSINKRYFLRSTDQQICERSSERNTKKIRLENTAIQTISNINQNSFRRNLLEITKHIINAVIAIVIFVAIHYKLLSEPRIIPLYRSICISLFTIIVLILPCVIFWLVFYADMIPNSVNFLQVIHLIFLGKISTRFDKNMGKTRDPTETDPNRCIISCNPLMFGFFSITLPSLLGGLILIYEIFKIINLLF